MTDWITENQHLLVNELKRIRGYLSDEVPTATDGSESHQSAPLLDQVCTTFGLSDFERDVLLLCAGMELDSAFAAAVADAGGLAPTFGLALAKLPGAHWSALSPNRPLRYWRLVELGAGPALVARSLTLDERILNHLIGIPHIDRQLNGVLQIATAEAQPMLPTQAAVADQIRHLWLDADEALSQPAVNLHGGDQQTRASVVATACETIGLGCFRVCASELPASPQDRETFARLWEREAALGSNALIIEMPSTADRRCAATVDRLVGCAVGLKLISSDQPVTFAAERVVSLVLPNATPSEQRSLWYQELGDSANAFNGQVAAVTQQFPMGPHDIRLVSARLRGHTELGSDQSLLWSECRKQSRAQLDDLAQRIDSTVTINDIVLPVRQLEQLGQIAAHVRHRNTVYEDWGFAAKNQRGLGISALFVGASGTGKTMAAEVLANELNLDLYRIDLSQVVSKYIGETEKNLAKVFDCAQVSGSILLFDEADALFGKRSEVRDSHDRFANVEISYLLQRMEAYRGLAILTTNMKEALDQAFLRRLRFVVSFPFPDETHRAEIWRRVFPADTPLSDFSPEKLAGLDVTGGNIRNIAMNAAFSAAGAGVSVDLAHIIEAARNEYMKLERPLPNRIGGLE